MDEIIQNLKFTCNPEEKETLIKIINLLNNHFQDNPKKLKELMNSLVSLSDFKIVTDVNESLYFLPGVRQISEKFQETFDFFTLKYGDYKRFRLEDGKYILDPNGDYVLFRKGIYSFDKNLIAVFEYPDLEKTFIHELEHATQKGFRVASEYFGSADLEFILREGDATDLALNVFWDDEEINKRIRNNTTSYEREYPIFHSLKFLLGEEFIEKWKKDESDTDYLEQIREYFKEHYNEGVLKEILALIYLIKNIDIMQPNELSRMKNAYEKFQTRNIDEIEFITREIQLYKQKLNLIQTEMQALEENLTNEKFLKKEAKKEKQRCNQALWACIAFYHKIDFCGKNKEKIKNLIETSYGKYEEDVDYKTFFKEQIKECENELKNNNFSDQVKANLKSQIETKKEKIASYERMIECDEKNLMHYQKQQKIDAFNLDIVERAQKQYQNFRCLSEQEQNYFFEFLCLKFQLLINECINKKMPNYDDSEKQLLDYLKLIESEYKNAFISEEGAVFTDEIIMYKDSLINSITRTLKSFLNENIDLQKNYGKKIANIYQLVKAKNDIMTVPKKQDKIIL